MDWMFYLIVSGVLFGVLVVIVAIRYLINARLGALEKFRKKEEEARTTAESNSGL